jgi:hypothetical protein
LLRHAGSIFRAIHKSNRETRSEYRRKMSA